MLFRLRRPGGCEFTVGMKSALAADGIDDDRRIPSRAEQVTDMSTFGCR